MNEYADTHLETELLQAMAEGELDPARSEPARAHLAGCGRCRAELEGWQLLFSELEELPDLGPAMGFADRVMAEVEVRPPLGERVADHLRRLLPARRQRSRTRHLSLDGMHEYLDDRLGLRTRRRVDQHLAACGSCRREVESWAPVFQSLRALPHRSPAEGFADGVMARVPVAAIAAAVRAPQRAWTAPVAAAARRLVPATRKGWAVVGGMVATPTVAMVAVVAGVLLHPLLTFQGLFTFAQWRIADALGAGWGLALEFLGSNALVLRGWEVVAAIIQAPGVAAFGFVALWASGLASAWVLYRHLVSPSYSTEEHAKASS